MKYPRPAYLAVLLLVSMGAPAITQADGLYRWFDSEGQLHFSDRPPVGGYEADRLQVPSFVSPAVPPEQNPYSILNQTKRLQEQREAIARERRERLEREREYRLRQREIELQRQTQQAPAPSTVVVYPRRYYRPLPANPPHWPNYQRPNLGLWKRDHPAYRPHGFERPKTGSSKVK